MRKTRFRVQFNDEHVRYPGEVSNGISMTVPDQSMSIREILLRYARGLGAPPSRPMFFAGDEYRPDLDAMDECDKVDFYRAVVARVESKQQELDELRSKRLKLVQENREKELKELADMRARIADFESKSA